jgi:cell division protein FtsN
MTAVLRLQPDPSGDRRSQHGGVLLGMLVGVVIGLVIAVAAAVYTTRSSVPFVNKVQRPGGERLAEVKPGESLPDPNRGWKVEEAPAPPPPPGPAAEPEPEADPPQVAAAQERVGTFEVPGAASGELSPAPAPAVGERSSYLLQAGAFRAQEDADAMKAKLALIGFEARIISAEVNGQLFFRVRVGPYAQIEDMNRARYRLAENGIEASVVRQR